MDTDDAPGAEPGDEHPDTDDGADADGYGGADGYGRGAYVDDDERIVDEGTGLYVERGYDQVKRARQRYGIAGAALAGAMIGLREVLEKPKEEVAVISEAPSDPVDLDGNGIVVALDGKPTIAAPPQHRPTTDAAAARDWTRNVLKRNRRR